VLSEVVLGGLRTNFLPDVTAASAILDRVLHHCEVMVINTLRSLVNQGGAQTDASSSCRGIRSMGVRSWSSAVDRGPTPKLFAWWSFPTTPRSAIVCQSAG
jgi:hypothetical protein